MPLPGNYGTCTVTGTIVDLHSGGAAAGTVKFTPELTNQFIFDSGADVVIAPTPTEVTLDDNGEFSVILGTTNDPDISPNGWTYKVEITTSAENGSNALRMVYSVQIPLGASPVDLADLSPAVATSGTTIMVKSVNGVTPDAAGNIALVGLLTIMNRNSTFETNVTGWEGSGGAITRSTAQFLNGVASLLLTPTGGVAAEARTDLTADGSPSVVVGETYFAAGWVMSPTGWATTIVMIDWLDAANAILAQSVSQTVDLIVNQWTYMSVRGTAPANTVRARMRFRQSGTPAAGDLLYVDEAVFAVAQVLPLTIDDLTDVSAAAPAANDILHFSGGLWQPSNRLTLLETQPNQQVFTAGGLWNKPANARWVHIRCQAGGGAGGGAAITAAAQFSMGAGGGGGGYAESILPASSVGTTETVTIGAGGAGAAGAVGGNGGSSSFGAHVVATGGTGGTQQGVVTAPASVAGGAGGAASAGQIQLTGSDGANSRSGASGQPASGGAGGSSHMGGARLEPAIATGGQAGNTGKNYGGGGSGGINFASQGTTKAGGNGAPGIVIVTTYF